MPKKCVFYLSLIVATIGATAICIYVWYIMMTALIAGLASVVLVMLAGVCPSVGLDSPAPLPGG
jgi:hypothetical protein